jgi:heptosyltransferase-2
VDYVDGILWLDRDRGEHKGIAGLYRLSQLLRSRRYQQVWLLHNSPRYAMAAWLAEIPEVIGYGVGAQRLFQNRHAAFNRLDASQHPIDKAALCLQRLQIPVADVEPHLPVAMDAVLRVREQFSALRRPWIAVGIGSSEPFKQWGVTRFAQLCLRIREACLGEVILVGGPGEKGLAEAICAEAGIDLLQVLDLSIRDTAALLADCALYVGNDTGFLNLAAATGVPAIGLFGGSPPLAHDSRIHCLLPEDGSTPWYGSTYMDRISVDAVWKALRAQLET